MMEVPETQYVFFTADHSGVLTYVSPSVVSILGYTSEQVIGTKWKHYLAKNTAKQNAVNLKPRSGRGNRCRICVCHADGSERFLEVNRFAVNDVERREVSHGIARDVTAQTRTEEYLRQANDRLEQNIIDRTSELKRLDEELSRIKIRYRCVTNKQTEYIFRWMPNGQFSFVSDLCCQVFRITRQDAEKLNFLELVHKLDRDHVRNKVQSLTMAHPIADVEHRVVLPNGEIVWQHHVDRGIFDEYERLIEIQSVGNDITGRKIAEDAFKARLAETSEAISGFVHEVNQSLNSISNYSGAAQLLLERDDEIDRDELHKLTRHIVDIVVFAGTVVNRFRPLSQQEPLEISSERLDDVVRAALEMLQLEADQLHVRISLELGDVPTEANVDRTRIQQVLVNLLKNAFDAVSQNPVDARSVKIHILQVANYSEVIVSDNGPGLGDFEASSLFEPFQSSKPSNLGIGLSICQSIIAAHGGTIWHETVAPHGTAFHVRIPNTASATASD